MNKIFEEYNYVDTKLIIWGGDIHNIVIISSISCVDCSQYLLRVQKLATRQVDNLTVNVMASVSRAGTNFRRGAQTAPHRVPTR